MYMFACSNTATFVSGRVSSGASPTVSIVSPHAAGCACGACVRSHAAGCSCGTCTRSRSMVLFSETVTEAEAADVPADVPAEVEAMDGIESSEEAHNSERPARKSLKKKSPETKPLSEFNVGDMVKAKVKALASYGAFMDIGASTDGLLHISNLSVEYVADIKEVLQVGKEYDVRITKIDEKKNQVALSLLSEAEEEQASETVNKPRQRDRPQRRDDSAVLAQLAEKGWDPSQFVEGTVVSTVDFGAFVKVDASKLNSEVEGEVIGLVHISALAAARVASVTDVVKVDDTVQVRVKDVADRKVALSMVSMEDEREKRRSSGGPPVVQGNKNWREDLTKLAEDMPVFQNKPLVVDNRK